MGFCRKTAETALLYNITDYIIQYIIYICNSKCIFSHTKPEFITKSLRILLYSDERNSVPHIIPYNRRVSFFLCGKECDRLGDRVAQNGQCEYNSPVCLCVEPVCLWLPEQYKLPETSTYVQGVEVAEDYDGVIPEGFDVITLDEADYLMFQGGTV